MKMALIGSWLRMLFSAFIHRAPIHPYYFIHPDSNNTSAFRNFRLKSEKYSVLADAEAKATRIDGMIQELLCIEYKPEDV